MSFNCEWWFPWFCLSFWTGYCCFGHCYYIRHMSLKHQWNHIWCCVSIPAPLSLVLVKKRVYAEVKEQDDYSCWGLEVIKDPFAELNGAMFWSIWSTLWQCLENHWRLFQVFCIVVEASDPRRTRLWRCVYVVLLCCIHTASWFPAEADFFICWAVVMHHCD